MSEISAASVGKLRGITGAGLMECKKALVETAGNVEAAVDLLRKKGVATAAKKADRDAKDGLIAQYIQPGSKVGVLAEINCETDFVARNESFKAFCDDVAKKLANGATIESLEADRVAAVAKTGENILIPRFVRFEVTGNGLVAAYIHTGAKVGVLVEIGAGKEATVTHDDFKQLVRDITLQIAAGSPLNVHRDEINPEVLKKEREIAAEQVKDKPPQAIAKIVEGKLEKFYQTHCLLDQGFVKRNSEVTLKEHIGSVEKQLGDKIEIRQFVRFQVGEAAA